MKMKLLTLNGLESGAEKKFEAQADEWVSAMADREGVGYDELRPHLVSLHYEPKYRLEAVFVIPEHTPIKLCSDYFAYIDSEKMRVASIENGKLVGDYMWYAFRTNCNGSVSFHGVKDLSHALLLARWAYEEDERAKWI
jgi:hypothetical protein